jgi:RNA polymerase sigma-70 factor (sigma-E family)
MGDRDGEFSECVDARALVLRRTAYLLCGDWHRAEDLVQTTFATLHVARPCLVRGGTVDSYARKVLVHVAVDEPRRGEQTFGTMPEQRNDSTRPEDRVDVLSALDELPPGQRAVVVLRYWGDQSVAETARLLGKSEGTIESQAAKGLATPGTHVLEERR